MSNDPIAYSGIFSAEVYYKCRKHSVSYPRGTTCPKCDHEKKKNISIS